MTHFLTDREGSSETDGHGFCLFFSFFLILFLKGRLRSPALSHREQTEMLSPSLLHPSHPLVPSDVPSPGPPDTVPPLSGFMSLLGDAPCRGCSSSSTPGTKRFPKSTSRPPRYPKASPPSRHSHPRAAATPKSIQFHFRCS